MYQEGNMTTSNRYFVMRFNGVVGARLKYNSSTWVTTSDIRFKKNVKKINNCCDKLSKINGINYRFTRDPYEVDRIGLSAQEVKEVFPELVSTFYDHEPYADESEPQQEILGIRYSELIPVLVNGINELSKTNKKTGMNENTNNSKNNIKNENMGLSFINELRPVTYDMDDTKHHGLVIDEVKSTLDTLSIPMEEIGIINGVSGMSGCYEINYKELVTPLIKAVQELSARVATLEALQ